MKKIAFAAVAALIATPAVAAPGDTDTATGAATATIISPINLTHTTGDALDFGTIAVSGATGGTVTVPTSGAATYSGVANVGTVAASPDSFTVSGEASRSVAITAAPAGTLAGPTGSVPMAYTVNMSAAPTSTGTTGSANFKVGGTLTVGVAQAVGSYTGSYVLTATYN